MNLSIVLQGKVFKRCVVVITNASLCTNAKTTHANVLIIVMQKALYALKVNIN